MSGRFLRRFFALLVVAAMLLAGASALADSIEVKLNASTKV